MGPGPELGALVAPQGSCISTMTSVDVSSERQVRAVLESLQTQSPKQAFNVCEKYLKKNPESLQLLAIKALLLVYQAKDLEGIALAKEVAGKKPTDIITLGNLDKVFVTANDYKASIAMFEEAFKSIPTEDIGALWYFSVLRTQDTKALFSIALKLHSMFKTPAQTYLFWAVLALHLQMNSPEAKEDSGEKSKSMKLAEKMILKAFASDRIKERTVDELLLLIITLQGTENYAEALCVLEEASGIKFANNDERDIIRAELLEKSGNALGAADFLQELMKNRGVFDWSAWKLYVKAIDGHSKETSSVLVEGLSDFLASIKSKTDSRSYLLAWVDAGIVFGSRFCTDDSLLQYICGYIEEFKDKGCCLPDIYHTSQSLKPPVLQRLAKSCGDKAIDSVETLHRNLTWTRCARLFRHGYQDKEELVESSIAEIARLIPIVKEIDSSAAIDKELSSLAHLHLATLYIDTFDVRTSREPLMHALSHAHQALVQSPDNFAIKLLLILVYLHLGNISAPLALFRSLNIKQLQIDTLAFLISDHILELGDIGNSEAFFHESFYIYDENRMNSWSLIAETLSHGSYANAPEFYEFARRLEYSMQAVACICGTIKTEMLTKDSETISSYLIGLKAEELIFDAKFIKNLSDNRDRDVIDFTDHSGMVRKNLLNALPTFGQVSMLIYTFLPIFFRSLITYDLEGLRHLLSEKFSASLALIDGRTGNRHEGEVLAFVKKLFSAISDRLCGPLDLEPEKFAPMLASLIGEVDRPSVEAELLTPSSIPSYDLFNGLWTRTELYRWYTLTVVFFIKGAAPSGKARKSLKANFQALLALLEDIGRSRIGELHKVAANLPQSPPGKVAMAPEAWSELLQGWNGTLKSYEGIYEGTMSLLHKIH